MRPFLALVAVTLVPTAVVAPQAGAPPVHRALRPAVHVSARPLTATPARPGSYAARVRERRRRAAEAAAAKLHPHAVAAKRSRLAPADEYFGHMKISVIEIGNRLKDVTLKIEAKRLDEAAAYGNLKYTLDAMQDWTKKYPGDTWGPRSMFALERLYAHFSSPAARNRAVHEQKLLVAYFPGSPEARYERAELAARTIFTPAPASTPFNVANVHALPPPVPTSSPVGSALPAVVLTGPQSTGTPPPGPVASGALSAPSGVVAASPAPSASAFAEPTVGPSPPASGPTAAPLAASPSPSPSPSPVPRRR